MKLYQPTNLTGSATEIMKNQDLLILLTGPSGVGKTTILQKLLKINPKLVQVPIYTTRPSRTHSETKISISDEEFDNLMAAVGGLAEMRVYGFRYAISKSHLENRWRNQKIAITDYVFRYSEDIKNVNKVIIYLLPPNKTELIHRLKSRGHGQNERIESDWQEVTLIQNNPQLVDLAIVNDDLDEAVTICEKFINSL